ncbi:MAG: hypothetical protein WC130_03860 [Kiritimatiellia bacterium]
MTTTSISRLTGLSSGVALKAPVRAATTANITLSGEQTVDGVALVEDDRVLVKNQTTASQNGIYRVVANAAWEREPDFDGARDVATGTQVFIVNGTENANEFYYLSTTGDITIGTTNLTFTKTAGSTAGAVAAAEAAQGAAEAAADSAEDDAALAESWAIDPIGDRPEGSAKYWAEQAASASTNSVKVSSNDTTPGDLEAKLIAGNGITLSTQNDGANETRTITVAAVQEADSAPASGTVTLNMNSGHYRKVSPTGNFTIDITPVTGKPGSYVLELVNGGAYTITWTGVDYWAGGAAPDLTAAGTDLLGFIAEDGGAVFGYLIEADFS